MDNAGLIFQALTVVAASLMGLRFGLILLRAVILFVR